MLAAFPLCAAYRIRSFLFFYKDTPENNDDF